MLPLSHRLSSKASHPKLVAAFFPDLHGLDIRVRLQSGDAGSPLRGTIVRQEQERARQDLATGLRDANVNAGVIFHRRAGAIIFPRWRDRRFENHPVLESETDSRLQENQPKNHAAGKEPGQLPLHKGDILIVR